MTSVAAVFGLAVLAGISTGALAQGTITDGSATFQRTGTPFDTTPTANFSGVSTIAAQDHVFEFGWWYRVNGQGAESVFGNPTSQNYTGDTSTIIWTDVGGLGLFNAVETATVTDTGLGGHFIATMLLTNTTQRTLNLSLFNMLDMDLQPTAGNDSATLLGAALIGITDPSGNTGTYQGAGATGYLVRPFGATDVGAVLSNAVADNFGNTGLPFGPGDFTGGYQWDLSIAAGAAVEARVLVAVNDPTRLRVPEPGTLALLGLGFAGLAASRRRKLD